MRTAPVLCVRARVTGPAGTRPKMAGVRLAAKIGRERGHLRSFSLPPQTRKLKLDKGFRIRWQPAPIGIAAWPRRFGTGRSTNLLSHRELRKLICSKMLGHNA